jgi:hypothetical protein
MGGLDEPESLVFTLHAGALSAKSLHRPGESNVIYRVVLPEQQLARKATLPWRTIRDWPADWAVVRAKNTALHRKFSRSVSMPVEIARPICRHLIITVPI